MLLKPPENGTLLFQKYCIIFYNIIICFSVIYPVLWVQIQRQPGAKDSLLLFHVQII